MTTTATPPPDGDDPWAARLEEVEGLIRAGRYEEARAAAEAFLAELDAIEEPGTRELAARAGASRSFGDVALYTGDYPAAARRYADALAAYEAVGDRWGAADAILSLGRLADLMGDDRTAARHFADALERYAVSGKALGVANAELHLGRTAVTTDDFAGAARWCVEAYKRFESIGNRTGAASSLHSLGEVAYYTRDYPRAASLFAEALQRYAAMGSVVGVANAVLFLGVVALHSSDFPTAGRLVADARERYVEIGDKLGTANAVAALGDIARMTGDFAQATSRYADALRRYDTLGLSVQAARTMSKLAECSPADDLGAPPRLYITAADSLTRAGAWSDAASALIRLAQLAARQGDREYAFDRARQAVDLLDLERRRLTDIDSRRLHGERWADVYETAVRLAIAAKHPEAALAFAARLLGRTLHEELTAGPLTADEIRLRLSDAERERLERLASEMATARAAYDAVVQAEIDRRRGRGEAPDEGPDERGWSREETAVRQATADHPATEAWLAANARWLDADADARAAASAARGEPPPPVSAEALADAVEARGVVLVLLLWRDNLHWAFVESPDGFDVHEYGEADVAEIDRLVAAWQADAGSPDRYRDVSAADWEPDYLDPLRERLWAPVARLVGDRPVRVALDRPLETVPVRHLHAGAGPLRVIPSPALLVAAPTDDAPAGGLVGIAADPAGELAGVDLALRLVAAAGGRAVPAAEGARTLLNLQGSCELLAVFGHTDPAEGATPHPSLRLAEPDPDQPGRLRRREVTAPELLGLRVRARHVIAQTCANLAGGQGPDLASVGAALLGGTRAEAVLASHVPVSDLAASLLWIELAPRLDDGTPLEVALDDALAVLAREITPAGLPGWLARHLAASPALAAWTTTTPDGRTLDFAGWVTGELAAISPALPDPDQPQLHLPDLAAWTVLGA